MEKRDPIPSVALTHGGKFHADDVFSAALLRILQPGIQIRRAFQVPEGFDGLVFDLGWGEFDHHQAGAPVRPNGVPYAAFGLLWRAFGERLLPPKEAARFDEKFIQPLDLDDNTGCGDPIAALIADFNPLWDSDQTPDQCFAKAVEFAETILRNRFAASGAIYRAYGVVKEALARMEDKVLVLDVYLPWKTAVLDSPAEFVVYPSQRGGYSAQGVPVSDKCDDLRCPFPASWAGKSPEELQRLTSLPTLRFCHNSRFLIAAGTVEDAVTACRLAQWAHRNR